MRRFKVLEPATAYGPMVWTHSVLAQNEPGFMAGEIAWAIARKITGAWYTVRVEEIDKDGGS